MRVIRGDRRHENGLAPVSIDARYASSSAYFCSAGIRRSAAPSFFFSPPAPSPFVPSAAWTSSAAAPALLAFLAFSLVSLVDIGPLRSQPVWCPVFHLSR